MSVDIKRTHDMLRFKDPIDLGKFSRAMGAYSKLHKLLTGTEAVWTDFTGFLEREGYVEAERKPDVPGQ